MKSVLKITVLSLLVLSIFANCITKTTYIKPKDKKQTEILLIGTFHFDNPGLDIVKTKSFEILNSKTQSELDQMAEKIKVFNPTKIFVEWPYQRQERLDSLYADYKKGGDFSKEKGEIVQLAFRVAKLNNAKLEAIDYNAINFPFEEVMEVIEKRNQTALNDEIMATMKKAGDDFNAQLEQGVSLTDMLLAENTNEIRDFNNAIYETILNAGNDTDFEGAQLVSQWNKRNLFMYSLIKKKTDKDERVMVLLGAAHIANIKRILDNNNDWKTIELKDVLTKKIN